MSTNSVLVQNPNPLDHILLGVEEREESPEIDEELDKVKTTTLYLLGVDIIVDIVEFIFMKNPFYLVMILFTIWGITGIRNERKYIIKLYLTYITILICVKIILLYTTIGIIVDISCLIMTLKTYNKLV